MHYVHVAQSPNLRSVTLKNETMNRPPPKFETRLARSDEDIIAAQRLRFRVFVEELGADGPLVDHGARREVDRFDAFADQLLLLDHARDAGDRVVGVYRLMDRTAATAAGSFYSDAEFDLGVLLASGRPLLELGRSCLHEDYRGGTGLMQLWQGLAQVVRARGAEVLFGVASFHGTDVQALAPPLSLLARDYGAPSDLAVTSRDPQPVIHTADIDRVAAMKQVPSLIKAYLRLGGFVGDGVFVDHAFNTTDVCLVLDVARMSPRQAAFYTAGTGGAS